MKDATSSSMFFNHKQLNLFIFIILTSVSILYLLTFAFESYITLSHKYFSIFISLGYIIFLTVVYFNNKLVSKAKYIYPISCVLIVTLIWYIEKGSINNIFIFYSILVMSTLYFDYRALVSTTISIFIINLFAFLLNKNAFFPNIDSIQFLGILISFIFVGIFLSFTIQRMIVLLQKARKEEARAKQEEFRAKQVVVQLENALHTLDKTYNELKQTQAQLAQREKMASLGALVAGVAHEINNPLGAINSNTSLFKMIISQLKSSEVIQKDRKIEEMIAKLDFLNNTNILACERIVEIVKSLRNFARLDEAEYKEVNIHEGIENTLVLLNHKLKNRIEVIKEYGELPMIKCYPSQLNQVFMNILSNAIDAIPDKGTIWIKTFIENEKVFIVIKDNGVGIKPEHINKIFDPGFTTKGVGVGTGLGLAITYNIIEKHHGKIYVQSQYGEGTEFTIELPIR